MYLSDRIQALEESQTIAMSKKSRELAAQGRDIINLSLGEPDFDTPDFIKEAAKKAIDDNFSHYTPVAGYADLREAVCHKLKRDNKLEYTPNQIVVSTGAKQSIANAILCLINPGDEVIIPAPYWVSYLELVKLAGGVPVILPTELDSDFKISAQQLEGAISPKTRLLLYSSPCNPSGSIYTENELKALAEVILKHQELYVISDEIYELINYMDAPVSSMAAITGMYDRTILINGLSKGYAMTGWRLGYMAAPAWFAAACDKMQGQITSATNSITQRAAIAALEAEPSRMNYMLEAFKNRRELVLNALEKMEGVAINRPTGAFYAYPDIRYFLGKKHGETVIKTAGDLCLFLLADCGVSTVTGEAFGSPECIRISYAASEENLHEAMKRIAASLAKLN